MPHSFTCPNCNAPLTYDGQSITITCVYCRTPVIVPPELRGEPSDTTPSGPPPDVLEKWAEIQALALGGKKIEAIKRMRETFEIGLKDAKDAIEIIEQGHTVDITRFQVISTRTPAVMMDAETTERILSFLQEGNKLQAVKLYREVTGSGLNEAVEAIDAIELGFKAIDSFGGQNYPDSTISSTTKKVATGAGAVSAGGGCLGTAIVIFIILVTIVPILIGMASNGGPLSDPWARINPFGRVRLVTSFGGEGTGTGLFEDPRYVATDNSGHIFVGEYTGGRIQVFDMDGKFLDQWTPINDEDYDLYLRGMAVDRGGMMYLAASGHLYVYNALSGERLGEIPSPAEYGYFDEVFVGPDSLLYATDSYQNGDILRFDRNRLLTLTIPAAISSITDESESTIRLGVDGLGTIYALGSSAESVFVFASDGRYVTRFGSEGEEKGQFTSTYALAVDNQSRVYVTDFGGLQVFSSDGRYLYKISMPAYIYGLLFTDDNHLLAVSSDNKIRLWEVK